MKDKIKKYFTLDNIIIYSLIIIFSYAYCKKTFDNDLFFDIKTGESILKYGLDFKEHFSFIPNLTYLYHHWFYDLVIHFIFNKFSYIGLYIFFQLIFLTLNIIYYRLCLKISKSKLLSISSTIITIILCSYAFQTRVQSITYILFILELYYLEKIYSEFSTTKYLIFLAINSIIIVNIHMPVWLLTIVFALPMYAELFLHYLSNKNKKIKTFLNKHFILEGPKNSKNLLIALLILLISGLISPFGLSPYTFIIKVALTNKYDYFHITELSSLKIYEDYYYLGLTIIFLIGIILKMFKFKVRDFILFVGLFIFGLIVIRNTIYFYLAVPFIFLRGIHNSDFRVNISFITNFLKKFKKTHLIIIKSFVLICIICIYVASFKEIDYKTYDFDIPLNYPVKAVEYIKENIDYKNIKMYNEFDYGSYLAFNDIPIFIDSRAEVYISDFNNSYDICIDYADSLDPNKSKAIFDKYKFDYALVYRYGYACGILEVNNDYIEVYRDEDFVLYERKNNEENI